MVELRLDLFGLRLGSCFCLYRCFARLAITRLVATYLIHFRNMVFPFWQVRLTTTGGPGALISVLTISGSELLPSFFRVYAFIQILYSE